MIEQQFDLPQPEKISSLNQNKPITEQSQSTQLPPGLQAGIGLAVASLVLGIVSLPLSLFVIGAGAGVIGLILGIVHITKKLPMKTIASWGIALSLLGTIAGAGFGVFYGIGIYQTYSAFSDDGDSQFEDLIGTAAPDMTLIDLQGNTIILSQLKGKRIILDFWATWCPPCKKEIPHFIKLRETISPDKLVIIGISNETEKQIESFANKHKINYPLAAISDEYLPEPYSSIASIPTTFFIDEQGFIENVLVGYHPFDELKENALGVKKTAVQFKTEDSNSIE